MQANHYTHADASAQTLRHVADYLPEPFKVAARLAQRVKHERGQSRYETTRTICRLLREGLK